MKYALDTNMIIFLLRDKPNVCRKFDEAVERGDGISIPPLVHFEMRRGFLCCSAPAKEKAYEILTSQFPISDTGADVLERAAVIYADLRRSGRTVEDADILIAAFCITNGYTLVTHNTRHFEGIDGLAVEDWAE